MSPDDDASPVFFSSAQQWRAWLERHHAQESEIHVGYWKVATGKPSMTWSESVDEALCFGWIDGVRHGVDADRYEIRFTPRRPDSHWSRVNIHKVMALTNSGRMAAAGLAAFEARDEARTAQASHERTSEAQLSGQEDAELRADSTAWGWFEAQAPWYRRGALNWVVSAKRPDTRARRLKQLIDCSRAGQPIPPLTRR